jgi:hypothetical protein
MSLIPKALATTLADETFESMKESLEQKKEATFCHKYEGIEYVSKTFLCYKNSEPVRKGTEICISSFHSKSTGSTSLQGFGTPITQMVMAELWEELEEKKVVQMAAANNTSSVIESYSGGPTLVCLCPTHIVQVFFHKGSIFVIPLEQARYVKLNTPEGVKRPSAVASEKFCRDAMTEFIDLMIKKIGRSRLISYLSGKRAADLESLESLE